MRELEAAEVVQVEHIATNLNRADFLTKPLRIGRRDIPSSSRGINEYALSKYAYRRQARGVLA